MATNDTTLNIDAARHADAAVKLEQAIALAEILEREESLAGDDTRDVRVSIGLLATLLRDADAALLEARA